MRDFLEGLGKKISETAETFTNKAGEVVEVQRIRNQIHTLERNNDRDFRDIGRMIYDKYRDGEVIDTDMACICEEIVKREESMDELEQMIADMKGTMTCPQCQNPVEKGMSYCPFCGVKLEQETAEAETEEAETEEADVPAEEAPEEAGEAEEVKEAAEEPAEE